MKFNSKLLLLIFPSFLLSGCGTNSEQKEDTFIIKDMLDRDVEIVKNPTSFACIGPGCLRQFSYVADPSTLVGIENCETTESSTATKPYLNRIPNISELPIIGQGGPKDTTDKEKLISLKPDVLFTSYIQDKSAIEQIQKQTRIPVVAVGYNSNGLFAKDIYKSIKLIGEITGNKERADEVVNYFETSKTELVSKSSKNPTTKTAYVGAVNHRGSFGIESTTGDFPIFDVLNIKNVVNDKGVTTFAKIEKESLISMQPDVMIIDVGGLSHVLEDMKEHPTFYSNLEAFKNHEVYTELPFVFYSNNFDVALANAYFIAKTFYPEEFKDLDIVAKFKEIENTLLGVDVYDKMVDYFKCGYGKLEYQL